MAQALLSFRLTDVQAELAGVLRATYPDASPHTIANNTGQVWHFVNTIALGDLVVVPLKGGIAGEQVAGRHL